MYYNVKYALGLKGKEEEEREERKRVKEVGGRVRRIKLCLNKVCGRKDLLYTLLCLMAGSMKYQQ